MTGVRHTGLPSKPKLSPHDATQRVVRRPRRRAPPLSPAARRASPKTRSIRAQARDLIHTVTIFSRGVAPPRQVAADGTPASDASEAVDPALRGGSSKMRGSAVMYAGQAVVRTLALLNTMIVSFGAVIAVVVIVCLISAGPGKPDLIY